MNHEQSKIAADWSADFPNATGWIADPSDNRDKPSLLDVSVQLPAEVDLREHCSPIEMQGQINSCTAHSAITLVEYFQKRTFDKYLDASRLFLYKTTRNLLHWTGDKGANSRTTMKALALFGVPPEEYWAYDAAKLDEEPPAFCYALASRYRALEYYRIDTKGLEKSVVVQQIKAHLAANRPLMFGFLLYQNCYTQSLESGKIPLPGDLDISDAKYSGHNMAAVGYNDRIKVKNVDSSETIATGAFLVKNSWGDKWGDAGYGWLPYEYVTRNLSMDWWTLMKQDWLSTGEFN